MNSKQEVEKEKIAWRRFTTRADQLVGAYKIRRSNTGDHNQLIRQLTRRVRNRTELKEVYSAISIDLCRSRFVEMTMSPAEDAFARKFAQTWRVRLHRQTWIGNLSTDFFIPALGQKRTTGHPGFVTKGIVFEVDGGIHEAPVKSNKDQYKEKYLHNLGICVWRIPNELAYQGGHSFPHRNLVLKEFGKLCSKERERLWTRIQLVTLLCNGTDTQLASVFPILNKANGE